MRVVRIPRALALGFVLGLAGCGVVGAGATPSPAPMRAAQSPVPVEAKPYVPVVKARQVCGSVGDVGKTKGGSRMECRKGKDGELRWQKATP